MIQFWWNSFGNIFFVWFFFQVSDVFFQGQTIYWPYLRHGWSRWCETKGSASVGYWVNYVTLTFTFALTHDLDLRFFKVKFQNSCISGIDVKWKRSWWIRYWTDYMTLPFDHSWPWSFKVKVWNSLISGIGQLVGLIDMVWKECELSNHDHDIELYVMMWGWVDVPYSDRTDTAKYTGPRTFTDKKTLGPVKPVSFTVLLSEEDFSILLPFSLFRPVKLQ